MKHWTIVVPALLLCAFAGRAQAQQLLSIGVKGGVPLTDFLNTPTQTNSALQYFQSTHRYELGASVELNLPARFGVEVDILHKSFEFQQTAAGTSNSPSLWEFPIVAKYRILPGPIEPYIEGGLAFSRITNVSDLIALHNRSSSGIVLGGGVEFRLGIIRISPEIRYNNLSQRFIDIQGLQSRTNEATFLVGIAF